MNKKNYILVFTSSLLYILSFPKGNLDYFAWFFLIPLFFTCKDIIKDYRKIAVNFFIFGIISSLAILFWVRHVTLAGYLTLSFYFAIYPLLFGITLWHLKDKTNFSLASA
jgi:apolipoprotein N-acyltransferase